jgi:hypothetical protein
MAIAKKGLEVLVAEVVQHKYRTAGFRDQFPYSKFKKKAF